MYLPVKQINYNSGSCKSTSFFKHFVGHRLEQFKVCKNAQVFRFNVISLF